MNSGGRKTALVGLAERICRSSALVGVVAPALMLAVAPALAQSALFENVTIGPGFSPNPMELRGLGGGSTPVTTVVGRSKTPTGECVGFTDKQPDHTLVLTGFFDALSLQVESAEDTALTIQGPGGVWCNDDYDGKNPGISGQWLAGTYKIWVSSVAKDRSPAYTLRITEGR